MGSTHLFLLSIKIFILELFSIKNLNMSREELKDFIKIIEYNYIAKEKVSKCKNIKDLISLAKEYRCCISNEDLKYDKTASKFNKWFKESKISPFRT